MSQKHSCKGNKEVSTNVGYPVRIPLTLTVTDLQDHFVNHYSIISCPILFGIYLMPL